MNPLLWILIIPAAIILLANIIMTLTLLTLLIVTIIEDRRGGPKNRY